MHTHIADMSDSFPIRNYMNQKPLKCLLCGRRVDWQTSKSRFIVYSDGVKVNTKATATFGTKDIEAKLPEKKAAVALVVSPFSVIFVLTRCK